MIIYTLLLHLFLIAHTFPQLHLNYRAPTVVSMHICQTKVNVTLSLTVAASLLPSLLKKNNHEQTLFGSRRETLDRSQKWFWMQCIECVKPSGFSGHQRSSLFTLSKTQAQLPVAHDSSVAIIVRISYLTNLRTDSERNVYTHVASQQITILCCIFFFFLARQDLKKSFGYIKD